MKRTSAGLLAVGVALLLSAGLIEALSPGSAGWAVFPGTFGVIFIVVVLGTPLRGGGGGIIGAVGGGITCAAVMMAPTPIALATMNHTMICRIPADRYAGTASDFDVRCPNGRTYSITSRQEHALGVPVRMLVDPHGVLRPEIADRVHVHKDELALTLSLLFGAGTVVAAYVNRRRLRGRVLPVVSPRA